MCGIAGIFELRPPDGGCHPAGRRAPATQALSAMVRALSHRGPDDSGTCLIEDSGCQVALGHTRLAILDLDRRGRQPMYDGTESRCLVYNGEIYNYRDLRASLGERWCTQTDTEVVLRGYARWGAGVLDRLRGMFAFALWDAPKGRLFLARDRLGIKPLYYFFDGETFVFASEVRAILASGRVRPVIDRAAVWQYLGYQAIPTPRSIIQGVHCLTPGTWMVVSATGEIQRGVYWDLLRSSCGGDDVAQEAIQRNLRERLTESVRLHMVSDVPIASFLSGGIDSSALVALSRASGYRPRTLTVAFAEPEFDESDRARRTAQRFDAEHVELRLGAGELMDELQIALASMDQPTGDGINTFVVSRAAQKAGFKVAQTGLGADELFAGYPSFRRFERARRGLALWGKTPSWLRQGAAAALRWGGGNSVRSEKLACLLASRGTPAEIFLVLRQLLSEGERKHVLKKSLLEESGSLEDPYIGLLEGMGSAPAVAAISYAEIRTYLQDVLLRDADQMGMACSVELRVPFLDHELVSYVMGLPESARRPNGTPKSLLVESMNGLLSSETVLRRKMGFVLPFSSWMREGLRSFCEVRMERDRLDAQGLFDGEGVDKMWQSFLRGERPGSWSRLWAIVVLSDWMERNGAVVK